MPPQRLFDIMSGKDRSLAGKAARVGLSCLEPFYRAAVGARNLMFDAGLRKPKKLPRPVISIGNITTGGTGKTPMVIEVVQRLAAMGQRPAVLLRGYRPALQHEREVTILNVGPGCEDVESLSSDEFQVLCGALPADTCIVAWPNRYQAGQAALKLRTDLTAFVLDDGFQHRQTARDVDLVLIDATAPFGHGRALPRGLLRESAGALRRATAIIVTRADQIPAEQLADLNQRITALAGRRPIAHVAFRWRELRGVDGTAVSLAHLSGRRVLGVCGVGNPAAFAAMLTQHAKACEVVPLPDHHAYTVESLAAILGNAGADRFDCVVTTEKDWVKWRLLLDAIDDKPAIYRACLHTVFLGGGEAVDELLRSTLDVPARASAASQA